MEKIIINVFFFQLTEIIKPTTTNLLLTDTLKMGRENTRAFSLFNNTDCFNTYVDQIQLSYDGEYVLLFGFLIEFYVPP